MGIKCLNTFEALDFSFSLWPGAGFSLSFSLLVLKFPLNQKMPWPDVVSVRMSEVLPLQSKGSGQKAAQPQQGPHPWAGAAGGASAARVVSAEKQGCPLLPLTAPAALGTCVPGQPQRCQMCPGSPSGARCAPGTGAAEGGRNVGLSPEPERGPGGGRGSSAPPCRVCALLRTSSHPVGENTALGARRRTKGFPPLMPAQQLGSVLLSALPLLLCFCPCSFRRLQGPAAAFPLGSVPAAAGKAREAPSAQLRVGDPCAQSCSGRSQGSRMWQSLDTGYAQSRRLVLLTVFE